MGPTWLFLLIFVSRVERHSMATCIPQVDGLSTDPRVGVSHSKSRKFPVSNRNYRLTLVQKNSIFPGFYSI